MLEMMKNRGWIGAIASALLLAAPLPMGRCADMPTTQPTVAATQPAGIEGLDELTGDAPAGRQGGGVRNSESNKDPGLWISALAPATRGLTTNPSPCLVFYLSKSTDRPVIVTITEQYNKEAPTLFNWTSSDTVEAGLHEIDLGKMNVKLRPRILYRWTAAVRLDDENPATQIFSTGLIGWEDNADAKDLVARTGGAAPLEQAADYGDGYFYDAVSVAYEAMRSSGGDSPAARKFLSDLLSRAAVTNVKVDVVHAPEEK